MSPKISIIIPSLNQGDFIEQCLQSIISQNYPNLEVIVIDGHSNDNTINIIKKYEKHIHYWVSEPDSGQAHAINKGLKVCSGELINWLNTDDILLSNALHTICNIYNQYNQPDLIVGASKLKYTNKHHPVLTQYPHPFLYHFPLAYPPFAQPSAFFSRNILEKTGYLDETLHYAMDLDLYARISLVGGKILSTQHIISKIHIHPNCKTRLYPLRFVDEWTKVFAKSLRTLGDSLIINQLQKLHLYDNQHTLYPLPYIQPIPQHILKKILYHFLHTISYYYVREHKKRHARILIQYILMKNPVFYLFEKCYKTHFYTFLS